MGQAISNCCAPRARDNGEKKVEDAPGSIGAVLNDLISALKTSNSALGLFKNADFENSIIEYQSALAIYRQIKQQKEALAAVDKAAQSFRKAAQSNVEAKVDIEPRVLAKYQEAVALYRELKGTTSAAAPEDYDRLRTDYLTANGCGEIETLFSIINANLKLKKRVEAKAVLEEAIAVCRSIGDLTNLPQALVKLGSLLKDEQSTDLAIKTFTDALEVLKEKPNGSLEANCHMHLGYLYQAKKESPKAIECYNRSLDLTKAQNDQRMQCTVTLELARAFYLQKDFGKAIQLTEDAMTLSQQIGDKRQEGVAAYNISVYLLNIRDDKSMKKSLEYCDQSLEIARELNAEDAVKARMKHRANVEKILSGESPKSTGVAKGLLSASLTSSPSSGIVSPLKVAPAPTAVVASS